PRADEARGGGPGGAGAAALPGAEAAGQRRPHQPDLRALPPQAGGDAEEPAEGAAMNVLGKALVLINFALSVVLLAWAVALFLRPVDWGWKEARKVWLDPAEGKSAPNERQASLIDERVAAYGKLREFRKDGVARARQAAARLAPVEGQFGFNRLVYLY